MSSLAAYPTMLQEDRERHAFTVDQAAWQLGVKPQEYRALEAGESIHDFETWDRICQLCGWPQTFAEGSGAS
jgi:DNA-binding XRE family transcriptional regulator